MQLSNENIAAVVADTQKFFKQSGVSKRDTLKIQLVVEEALLRWQDYFGETKDFEVRIQMRKWFDTPKFLIVLKGDEFNPIEESKSDVEIFSAEVMQNLLIYEGARTTYSYHNGWNELSILSTKERRPFLKLPGGSVTVAILLGIAATFLVHQCPPNVQDFLVNGLAIPLLSTLMQLIVAVTIPTVFVSVVASVCVMENVTFLSNIGFRVLRRFVVNMLIIIAVSMCACAIFFPIISLNLSGNALLKDIIQLFLSAVPTNFFKPFVEGNVLQVVMIALFTGACVVILSQRIPNLKAQINELKEFFFKMSELTLKLIPLTIFLSIFKLIMTTSISELFVVWRAVAACYLTVICVAIFFLVHLKLKYKLNLVDFIKKNSPVFITTLVTASGTASMMVNFDVCKKTFKIDPNLCDFWIPMSHTLFSPGTVNVITACAFTGAFVSNATISVSQLLLIAFLAIQLSIVNPKVYGGNIAGFMILLTQLGFPTDVVGQLVIIDVFTINTVSLFGMIVRNCEIYDLSHQVTFSDTSLRT